MSIHTRSKMVVGLLACALLSGAPRAEAGPAQFINKLAASYKASRGAAQMKKFEEKMIDREIASNPKLHSYNNLMTRFHRDVAIRDHIRDGPHNYAIVLGTAMLMGPGAGAGFAAGYTAGEALTIRGFANSKARRVARRETVAYARSQGIDLALPR